MSKGQKRHEVNFDEMANNAEAQRGEDSSTEFSGWDAFEEGAPADERNDPDKQGEDSYYTRLFKSDQETDDMMRNLEGGGDDKDDKKDDKDDKSDKKDDKSGVLDPNQPITKVKRKIGGKEVEFEVDELVKAKVELDTINQYFPKFGEQPGNTQQPGPELTPEQKALQAQQQLEANVYGRLREQQKFDAAREWFQKDFEDLTTDPTLFNIFATEDQNAINNGDTRPYVERWTEVGNKVRAWRDGLSKSSGFSSKDDEKASRRSSPGASSTQRSNATSDSGDEEDLSSTIKEMATRRGHRTRY